MNAGCNDDGVDDWVACIGNPWSRLKASSLAIESRCAIGILCILDAIRPSYYWQKTVRLNTAPTVAGKLRDPQPTNCVADSGRRSKSRTPVLRRTRSQTRPPNAGRRAPERR